jgi:adenine-specific DNA-methyltransferase
MTLYHQKLPPSGEAREALRKKGQFWTPAWIAEAMAAYVLAEGSDHVFDPAVGEGAFLRAAKQESLRLGRPLRLMGTEIDLEILRQTRTDTLTEEDLAGIEARDFLFDPPQTAYDAILANPPYIRHHRLAAEDKQTLKKWSSHLLGKALDGRAGLHIYFLLRALTLLRDGGRLAFILPADVCEGKSASTLWQWITSRYCLDAVVTFEPEASPFPGVDTNALIFFIRKAEPRDQFLWVRTRDAWTDDLYRWVTEGLPAASRDSLSICRRSLLEGLKTGFSRPLQTHDEDCPKLGDFCTVMRGIATGDNEFFFLTRAQAKQLQIPEMFLLPAVGRTRDVTAHVLTTEAMEQLDKEGRPTLLFAPDARRLNEFPPQVQTYLLEGEARGLAQKALISQRKPWYNMEKRRMPPFLFAYLGRRNVRFIRNQANALPLTSFLCVYPRQDDPETVNCLWRLLQHPSVIDHLASVGKSYGSGAIKVEPRALEALPIPLEALQESGLVWMRLFERNSETYSPHADVISSNSQQSAQHQSGNDFSCKP